MRISSERCSNNKVNLHVKIESFFFLFCVTKYPTFAQNMQSPALVSHCLYSRSVYLHKWLVRISKARTLD